MMVMALKNAFCAAGLCQSIERKRISQNKH